MPEEIKEESPATRSLQLVALKSALSLAATARHKAQLETSREAWRARLGPETLAKLEEARAAQGKIAKARAERRDKAKEKK
jgi:hypothetical protein